MHLSQLRSSNSFLRTLSITSPTRKNIESKRIYAAAAAGVSVFLGVALGVFLGVAAFFGAGFFFCTAPAVLAGPFVILPEAVLAETFFSSTIAGAWVQLVSDCRGRVQKDHDTPLRVFSSHVWSTC